MQRRTIFKSGFQGFTLIEVLVATVLMALMGTLLMASINASIKAKDTVEETSGRYHMVRQAMTRMAHEISMAYLSKHIHIVEPAYLTQFKGKKDALYFSAFGHVVHQKDAKQSDQQVIAFYLGRDRDGQQSLMRRVHPNLNRDVEKGGNAQVLCPNVTKLEFSYFDSRMGKWEDSWTADPSMMVAAEGQVASQNKKNKEGKEEVPEKTASQPKSWRLPSFVKISMTIDMGEGLEMVWTTETQIPIQEALDLALAQ